MSRFLLGSIIAFVYAAVACSQEDKFYQAILSDNVEIVDQLIKSGEDPNREFRNKVVPLHLCKSEKMAKLLIEHGAITEKRSSRQKLTPLETHARDYAIDRKSYPDGIEKRKLIDSLLRAGAIYTDNTAAYLGDVEHFKNHAKQGDGSNLRALAMFFERRLNVEIQTWFCFCLSQVSIRMGGTRPPSIDGA